MPDRRSIVSEAQEWIGTPYHHGARAKGLGCDCLGLLTGVWEAVLGQLPDLIPPYTPDWGETDRGDPLLRAARERLVAVPSGAIRPGDVILFRWRPGLAVKHIGIAVAPDRMIHAYDGAGVVVVAIVPAWRKRIAGVFAFPGVDG